jgi:hypothetical protein
MIASCAFAYICKKKYHFFLASTTSFESLPHVCGAELLNSHSRIHYWRPRSREIETSAQTLAAVFSPPPNRLPVGMQKGEFLHGTASVDRSDDGGGLPAMPVRDGIPSRRDVR